MKDLLVKEIVAPIIIIVVFSLIYIIIKKVLKRMMKLKFNNIDEKRKKTVMSLITNVIKYFLLIIAILMILNVYGVNTSALLASLGVIGLVIGLALQNTLNDFISGLFIIIENQYGIGDVVTISSFKGEVISLGLKTTKIKAYTGEIKIISNRNIVEVINHSIDISLAVVNVQIPYEADIDKTEIILNKLCLDLNKKLPYLMGEIQVLGVTDLGDYGVEIRIVVETEPTKQYEIERLIRKEVKTELQKHNITIPYPQVVVHNA